MLPAFDPNGFLPVGIHMAMWEEVVDRFGTTPWRLQLLGGLRRALTVLRDAGCMFVYIDGSFVTAKDLPDDYDACWDITGVNSKLIDPILLRFDDGRAAMKTKYLGDLFPAQCTEGNTGTVFLDFFQIDRETGCPKGIIVIDLSKLP